MKILFDHQIFTLQKYGGISRYFAQIYSNLPSNIEAEIAIKYSDNEYIKQTQINNNLRPIFKPVNHFLWGVKFPGKKVLFKYLKKNGSPYCPDSYELNKRLSIELLKKQDFDIFHPTYYDDYFLEYIGTKPFVLDIHDMIHEIYPEMLQDSETSRRKAILAHKANHIIAVSEKTKADIIKILGVPASKISVIYRGNTFDKPFYNSPILNLPKDYLLYIGDRNHFKNFLFFLSAIQPILKENREMKLICTGNKFNENEKKYIDHLAIESQLIAMPVDDKRLFELYSNAKAFIFPSYYEGFGIPILEALQTGCPTILSNASCFPEIAKDAALYFDPKSLHDIRTSIEKVLYNDDIRKTLVKKGYERSKTFSWENSVAKTTEIYQRICNAK
jgi:glycosyltransferase involved in cell wall biosynthesis